MKLVFVTLFFAISLAAQASEADVLAGIFPEAKAYPHSDIVAEESQDAADYLLGLGALQKIHGVWKPKKSIRLNGDLHRFTYQISGGRDVQSAIEYLQKNLSSDAAQLYSCEARGCGSSAQWASLIFKRRELYGLDSYQHYLAYRLPSGGKVYFLAIYGVKRANGRQYLHLDVLESTDTQSQLQPSTLVAMLENGKVFSIPALAAGQLLSEIQLQSVLGALAEFEGQVALVCHRYGKESAEVLLASTKQWCEKVKDQLIESAIEKSRLITLGAGSLQPAAGLSDRLELLAPQ